MGAGHFFGVLLLICGVLMATLCGLCTLAVIGVSLSAPADPQGYGGGAMIPIALLLGGLPAAFGGLMIFAGALLIRAAGRTQPPPSAPPPS